MDFETSGLMPTYWNAHFDPWQRWFRPTKTDRRLITNAGGKVGLPVGGRRMRHPFLDDIVYPRPPDQTLNFDQDPMPRVRSVVTKTLDASATSKFKEEFSDVVIREVWNAETLSTTTELARQFYLYLDSELPVGQFIGWRPVDRSPKNFAIELLDVQIGRPDAFFVEELGSERPFHMRQALIVSFKFIREDEGVSGAIVQVGN